MRKLKGKEVRYTPRGYKVDIYTRDVSGISIENVVTTARDIEVRRGATVKAASVEVLLVSKFRAAAKRKGTDDVDIHTLVQRKYHEVEWETLRLLTDSEVEFQRIKSQVEALHRMQARF